MDFLPSWSLQCGLLPQGEGGLNNVSIFTALFAEVFLNMFAFYFLLNMSAFQIICLQANKQFKSIKFHGNLCSLLRSSTPPLSCSPSHPLLKRADNILQLWAGGCDRLNLTQHMFRNRQAEIFVWLVFRIQYLIIDLTSFVLDRILEYYENII